MIIKKQKDEKVKKTLCFLLTNQSRNNIGQFYQSLKRLSKRNIYFYQKDF